MLWLILGLVGCGGTNPAGPLQSLEFGDPAVPDSVADPMDPADTGDTGDEPVDPEAGCARHIPPPAGSSRLGPDSFSSVAWDDGMERGSCLVVEDLDRDGWPDIFTMGQTHTESGVAYALHVLWGGVDGPVEHSWPVPGRMDACTATDLDGDGNLDILGGQVTGLWALHSDGARGWSVQPDVLPLSDTTQLFVDSVARFDIDGVPPLDLMVGTAGHLTEECISADDDPGGSDVRVFGELVSGRIQCFVGQVDGSFVAAPEGVCPDSLSNIEATNPYALHLADFDDDTRPDVFLGNDFSENYFLRSQVGGGLVDETSVSGLGAYDHAMGSVVADFNGDGLRDVYVSDVGPDGLFLADDCTSWYDAALVQGVADGTDRTVTWGSAGQDFDLDGDIDLMVTLSLEVGDGGFAAPLCAFENLGLPDASTILFVNDGTGQFERVDLAPPPGGGLADWYYIRLATADLDRDGDMDAVSLSEPRGLRIHTNETETEGTWVSVLPLEHGLPATGARIVVRHSDGAERMQELYGTHGSGGHSELRAHFGLGAESGPIDVSVRWPDGAVSEWEGLSINQMHDLER